MDALIEKVSNRIGGTKINFTSNFGELTFIFEAHEIHRMLQLLRDDFGFDYFIDLTVVDHFRDTQRFEISYNLISLANNKRIRVKTFIEEENPVIDSAVDIWAAANWNEREAFDMFGIRFAGHPDLRRMFMPEDFEYYPLRKEFPLIGIPGSIQLPEKESGKAYR